MALQAAPSTPQSTPSPCTACGRPDPSARAVGVAPGLLALGLKYPHAPQGLSG